MRGCRCACKDVRRCRCACEDVTVQGVCVVCVYIHLYGKCIIQCSCSHMNICTHYLHTLPPSHRYWWNVVLQVASGCFPVSAGSVWTLETGGLNESSTPQWRRRKGEEGRGGGGCMCGPVTYEERGLTLMSPYRYHSAGHPYSPLLKNTLTEAHKGQLLPLCWISNFHCTLHCRLPLHTSLQTSIADFHCKLSLQTFIADSHYRLPLQTSLHTSIAHFIADFHCKLPLQTSIANFHCRLPLQTFIANFHCQILCMRGRNYASCHVPNIVAGDLDDTKTPR